MSDVPSRPAKSHPNGLYLRAHDPSSSSSASDYLIKPGFCPASDESHDVDEARDDAFTPNPTRAKEPRRAGGGSLGKKAAAVGRAGAGAAGENRAEKAKRGGKKSAKKEARKARREATRDGGGGGGGGGDEDVDAKGMHQAEEGIEALMLRAEAKMGAATTKKPDQVATVPVLRLEDLHKRMR